jgi:hypothetical protein
MYTKVCIECGKEFKICRRDYAYQTRNHTGKKEWTCCYSCYMKNIRRFEQQIKIKIIKDFV